MRAGVKEVFALEIYLCAAQLIGKAFGEIERGGAAAIVVEHAVEFSVEDGVGVGERVGVLELFEGGHEVLGDVAAPVGTEASGYSHLRCFQFFN